VPRLVQPPRRASRVRTGLPNVWAPDLYAFAGDGRLYARAFVPTGGIAEDPATGSACAGLVASLALRTAGRRETLELSIDQGVRMGRPSSIRASARLTASRLTHVSVGGAAAVTGRGVISLDVDLHQPSMRGRHATVSC
jgi:trans-2,3-dihydro-3-hydroxyanthranilate isomerase